MADVKPAAEQMSQESTPVPAVQVPGSALADRMARFKALQAQKLAGRKDTEAETRNEQRRKESDEADLDRARRVGARALFKIEKLDDSHGRKQAWDYTAEENENWDRRVEKKQKHKANNVFRNFSAEGNKVYKRQVKQMGRVNLEAYQANKAAKIQDQLDRGILVIREDDHGNTVIVDPATGRENEPAEESHMIYEHRPDREALDRLVADAEKAERNRLENRRRNKQDSDNQGGDVTYINEKNKQFNLRLARAYNKHTAETRESFERGTAL